MKTVIDQWIYLNYHRLDNEDAFKQDVLSLIGKKFLDLDIPATISDRKYINNLITTEYFQQRASAY
jgi:type I restriction enzyme R subunit